MGYHTYQKETLNVLDAHMNARCDDYECETCPLRLTKLTKDIDYCYALSIFSEKFFVDNGLRKGEEYYGDYVNETNKKFSRLFMG